MYRIHSTDSSGTASSGKCKRFQIVRIAPIPAPTLPVGWPAVHGSTLNHFARMDAVAVGISNHPHRGFQHLIATGRDSLDRRPDNHVGKDADALRGPSIRIKHPNPALLCNNGASSAGPICRKKQGWA